MGRPFRSLSHAPPLAITALWPSARDMRRDLLPALALSAMLSAGMAAIASANAPVTVRGRGQISTADGTHPIVRPCTPKGWRQPSPPGFRRGLFPLFEGVLVDRRRAAAVDRLEWSLRVAARGRGRAGVGLIGEGEVF